MSNKNSSKISRRDFLKSSAISLAAFGGSTLLSGCKPKELPIEDAVNAEDQAITSAVDWLGTAPEISDADCVETVDTEVLVVGAGCSGLFAACAAAESGAKILLIEKMAKPNGVRSSALGAIGTKMQKEAGVEINKVDIVNDICQYALNYNDMNLVKTWADNSGEAIDWYIDFVNKRGKCQIILEHNMPKEETRYKMWPTGHGTVSLSDENAEALVAQDMLDHVASFDGCEYRTETKLETVIMEEGKAVGIYASNADNEYIRINASKGVIIATGGYGRNEEMFTALQGESKKSLGAVVAFVGATGDGIRAAKWAGGKFDENHGCMIFDRCALAPDQDFSNPYKGGIPYFHIATQPFLKVNKAGKRICNESSPYDFVIHAAANYEDKAWYQVFDSNWREDVTRFHTIGCSTLTPGEGRCHEAEGLDAVEGAINAFIEDGLAFKADTLEELAEKLGIDAANLVDTADHYNELYEMGEDTDFGKESFRLSSLSQAPYYGVRLAGILLCTLDGIQIDTNGQAINENDELIPGLFIVGNDSGKYYLKTYPNFGAGTNAGRCATFGRICGKHVASL